MQKKKTLLRQLKDQKWSLLFIAPVVLLFVVFVLGPLIASFYWSFTDYNGIHSPRWVGLDNYKNIFTNDPRFWKAISNTIFYTVGVIPAGVVISLLLALAIDQKIKFKKFFGMMYFIPAVTSVIALSVVWKWMFAGEKYGLINHFLILMGFKPIDWLMSTTWTLPAIMVMSIWAGIGYNMIIFLAGLYTIPATVYEAADIDGCNEIQKFFYITLPLVKPIIFFMAVTGIIGALNAFTEIYAMTKGGPILTLFDKSLGATKLTGYYLFTKWEQSEYGYAAAMSYALLILTIVISKVQEKFLHAED
ncbi:MAG TPA: sugar ABC transporter permease [Candidatus Wallbacteria bacterium]|nr:sugar ABC transporter permease [Candidatus Wallbacteria bacterium]